jgi:hypothetical protein
MTRVENQRRTMPSSAWDSAVQLSGHNPRIRADVVGFFSVSAPPNTAARSVEFFRFSPTIAGSGRPETPEDEASVRRFRPK